MRKESDRHYEEFMAPKQIEGGGLVTLSGAFLKDHEDEILGLIKHESALSEESNPAHKVTSIEKKDDKIIVKTAMHGLAMHIGKSLMHAYKGDHKFTFSHDEKYVEVDWRRD